ncbi:MAG: recombinase family protein [Bacteroidales bacterium]|nr:recombinase family protein [Bacteroidales bacterium]
MSTYAYIRVSTEMQCYASQENEIRRYCKSHRIVIDEWVSESISGTIDVEKRILGKTIEHMEKGDLLVCTELSRLGRNMLMIMGVLDHCSKKGVSIQTIKDNFMLSDSINSKIIAFAFALAAEIERNLISQRTKEALAVKKMEGVKLGRPSGSSRQKLTFYKEYPNIHRMMEEGEPMYRIAGKYGFHRNTLRRYLVEFEKMKENMKF